MSQNSCQMWIELVLSSESWGVETNPDPNSSTESLDTISKEEWNDVSPRKGQGTAKNSPKNPNPLRILSYGPMLGEK